MQLALINLDSNGNVDDGFVFAGCRRNITSGLTQVASFMLSARNIVIVMSRRLLSSCISVAAACTVSCFSKIQIGFTFLVPAHLGSPEKGR